MTSGVVLLRAERWADPVRALLAMTTPPLEVMPLHGEPDPLGGLDDEEPSCLVHLGRSADDVQDALRAIEERDVATSLVVLLARPDAALALAAQGHAAAEVLSWPASEGGLGEHVRRALARSAEVLDVRRRRAALLRRFEGVTPRELDVLDLLRRGHPSKVIARELDISKRTVDDHRRALLRKTGDLSAPALVHGIDQIELLRCRELALTRGRWRPEPVRSPLPEDSADGDLDGDAVGDEGPDTHAQPVLEARTNGAGRALAWLGRLLAELECSEDSACMLDANLQLTWTNRAWARFAPTAPQREAIARDWRIGARYVDAIAPPLDTWYAERLGRCAASGERWEHAYDCPTKEQARRARLVVAPAGDNLVLRHELLAARAHARAEPLAPRLESRCRVVGGAVAQCMGCRCVAVGEPEGLVVVPEWIERTPRPVHWFLCPSCEAAHDEVGARPR